MSVAAAADLDAYRGQFRAFDRDAPGPAWLERVRREAMERFLDRGFPTTNDEDWRSTSVAPIARSAFLRPDPGRPGAVPRERLAQLDFGGAFAGWEIVFVDGHYSPQLSSAAATADVRILSLREVLIREPGRLEPFLSRIQERGQPFADLNTAFLDDGAFVEIAPGAQPSAAIHLIYFSTGAPDAPTVSHPRTLVVAGRGSHATLVETYAGARAGAYFANAVTEIVVGEAAVLDHYKLQREGSAAFHTASLAVRQERGSVFSDTSVCVGGALVRNDVVARFAGEGGECVLNGLFVASGTQHHDTRSLIDHARPRCASRELYKGVVAGRARGVFTGRIVVRPDAQHTDAQQVNKNVLLSPEALVHSTPQLEIFADDVRCKHGSTTGQLDTGALFYLRSRGIGEEAARALLVYAFASDVVSRVKLQPIRVALEAFLHTRLPATGAGDGGDARP